MKRKYKIASAAGFGLAILFLLTGCGGNPASKDDEKTEKTVITVWTKDRHDGSFWKEKVEAYNESNPDNIEVKYKIYADNYAQAIDSAFQSNGAPDIMTYTDQIFYENYTEESFLDLTPYMDETFRETFSDVMFEGMNVIDGKCYFIPTGATSARLFYNQDILSAAGITEPPSTMEELIEDARCITEKFSGEGIYGFALNMKNAQSGIDRSIMKEANMELGLKAGFDFGSDTYRFEAYTQMLQNWRELLSTDCAYPYCDQLDIDPLRQLFSEGKIAMYMSYVHAEQGVYDNQFPMDAVWGCVQLPVAGGEIVGAQNYALNNGYLINVNCENKEAAWKAYCGIFANVDTLAEYYAKGLGMPIVEQVIDAAIEKGYETENSAMLLGEYDHIWPKAPHEKDGSTLVIEGLDMYDTFRDLIFGNADIASELKKLSRRYNEAYQMAVSEQKMESVKIIDFDPFFEEES